jgi:hypothetical protein
VIKALAAAHIVIAVALMPLTLAASFLAPLFMIGPVWAIVVGRRMWRREPGIGATLRRTHAVFLAIDALMIWYGSWMLQRAAESAARGGGLLGGLGAIPIALGSVLALFSVFVLFFTRRL